MFDEEEQKPDANGFFPTDSKGLAFGWKIAIFFFYITGPAYLYSWIMFRKLRYPFSWSLFVSCVGAGITFLIGDFFDFFGKFKYAIHHIFDGHGYGAWWFVGEVCVILIFAMGSVFVLANVKLLESSPELRAHQDSPFYNFSYRPTPLQKLKLKKIIEKLRLGVYDTPQQVSLGVTSNETNDYSPVLRKQSDVFQHTLVTGGTGSGKPLWGQTPILTSKGYRRVNEVNVGDTIFDNYSKPTKVIGKYNPKTLKKYKFTFGLGDFGHENIIAGVTHLWLVDYNNVPSNRLPILLDDEKLEQARFDLAAYTPKAIVKEEELLQKYNIDDREPLPDLLSFNNPLAEGAYSRQDLIGLIEGGSIGEDLRLGLSRMLSSDERGYYSRQVIKNYLTADLITVLDSLGIEKVTRVYYAQIALRALISECERRKTVNRFLDSGIHEDLVLSTWDLLILDQQPFIKHISAPLPLAHNDKIRAEKPADKQGAAEFFATNPSGEFVCSSIHQREIFIETLLNTVDEVIDFDVTEQELFIPLEGYGEDFVKDTKLILQSLGFTVIARKDDECYIIAKRSEKAIDMVYSIVECSKDYDDNDFWCFTVDSKDNVFLVGESLIATHNTITIQNIALNDIISGRTVIVVDFKKDLEFAVKLAKWAHQNDAEFYHFIDGDPKRYNIPYSKGQCTYDPLISGSDTSKADRTLSFRTWDSGGADAFYKTNVQNVIGKVYRALSELRNYDKRLEREEMQDKELLPDRKRDFYRMREEYKRAMGGGANEQTIRRLKDRLDRASVEVRILENKKYEYSGVNWKDTTIAQFLYVMNNLTKIVEQTKGDRQIYESLKRTVDVLNDKGYNDRTKQLHNAIYSTLTTFEVILNSDYGVWLNELPGVRKINLTKLMNEGGNVVLFQMSKDDEKDFATFMGTMILDDITTISSERITRGNGGGLNEVTVVADESQTLPTSSIRGLLERGRAAKIATILGFQSLQQVVAENPGGGGTALVGAVLDTCGNFIVHSGSNKDTAEMFSKIVGTHKVLRFADAQKRKRHMFSMNYWNRRNAVVNTTEKEEYIIPPSSLMNLEVPTKDNGFKSEAVIIKKGAENLAKDENRTGSGSKVLMIPRNEVLEKIKVPRTPQPPKQVVEAYDRKYAGESFDEKESVSRALAELNDFAVTNDTFESLSSFEVLENNNNTDFRFDDAPMMPEGYEDDVFTPDNQVEGEYNNDVSMSLMGESSESEPSVNKFSELMNTKNSKQNKGLAFNLGANDKDSEPEGDVALADADFTVISNSEGVSRRYAEPIVQDSLSFVANSPRLQDARQAPPQRIAPQGMPIQQRPQNIAPQSIAPQGLAPQQRTQQPISGRKPQQAIQGQGQGQRAPQRPQGQPMGQQKQPPTQNPANDPARAEALTHINQWRDTVNQLQQLADNDPEGYRVYMEQNGQQLRQWENYVKELQQKYF